ncbi:spore germination protein [Paenibacillus glycanilyticus]|uniref:spore germination protein n=1 Tax=Paenibacillus glycanilyticus TaxID=126569 RepID=UPI0020403967|nr:spore germination protein [Paenibacillus glycanilyticus]MCM3626803.1 spore germination protein [Paenibacillus glycanilyticus]
MTVNKKTDPKEIVQLLQQLKQSSDFQTIQPAVGDKQLSISYFKTMIDERLLQSNVILSLQDRALDSDFKQLEDLKTWIPIEDIEITDQVDRIQAKLLRGCAIASLDQDAGRYALIHLGSIEGLRKNNDTENEFSVVGPKVGLVEDLDINIGLLRSQINIPTLVVKEIIVGTTSKTRVAIVYIDDVTNKKYVQTVQQRLERIDYDVIFDTSQLDQLISDNSLTPFPLFLSTERRDRVVYALITGQVAVISDGSPYSITGPSTLFDFFLSPEDYYLPWVLGSFFRMIRIFGVIFSLFATSMYIAVTTFHYEVIPRDLLEPLIFSRRNVPFPPLLEVLFLEITIEFLREAGARLPTKIGQTLGIVGGIVIGQATVLAGLTSNILVIIVAFSALASFATPIYKMSNAIRFLRFPMIFASSIWGALGMFIGIGFLLVHLSRLTSLGMPYLVPIHPLRVRDLRDSFIRPSYQFINKRPGYLRTESTVKYKPGKVKRRNDLDRE